MVQPHGTADTVKTDTLAGVFPGLASLDLPEWMFQSLCSQTDPEAWFPEKGGSTREAKSICARCPVAAECLDYALEHDIHHGIWGGLSERERRKVAKALGKPQTANARKAHCANNHPYDEENTYVRPDGGRGCRACIAENQRNHRRTS